MIQLDHVQKTVDQRTLLDIDTLHVGAGEVAGIIGPVGSGKSLLFSLLIGQVPPTSGTVRIAGLDPVRNRDKLTAQIGVVLTENGLYERMSARANLLFHCRLRGLPPVRADEVLDEVGLVDHAGVNAAQLAPSLARRLAIGRALLHRPPVLLMLHPLRGCDSASRALIGRLIQSLAEKETAILMLTDEAADIAASCDTLYTLDQGHLIQNESSDQPARLPFKVPARQEGQVILVNPVDILYASAEEGQTCLHTLQGPIISHLTLNELEKRLAHNGFFRAHRGFLVNLQRAKAITPFTRDSFILVLDDEKNTEIPLSKTAARELRELLGY